MHVNKVALDINFELRIGDEMGRHNPNNINEIASLSTGSISRKFLIKSKLFLNIVNDNGWHGDYSDIKFIYRPLKFSQPLLQATGEYTGK